MDSSIPAIFCVNSGGRSVSLLLVFGLQQLNYRNIPLKKLNLLKNNSIFSILPKPCSQSTIFLCRCYISCLLSRLRIYFSPTSQFLLLHAAKVGVSSPIIFCIAKPNGKKKKYFSTIQTGFNKLSFLEK